MQFGSGCPLWVEFAPFPSPLPPASRGGWAGLPLASSSLELLSPFVLQTTGSVFGLVNFLSLAIPQFKLLCHVSSLRLPSGLSGPILTLSNASRSSPFHPHHPVADAGIWGTFLLGVAFMNVICGFYFSSQLGYPLRFENFPQTRP